ncbi:protein kinase [Modestobacter sp. VKM Ac-2979]|uniref:protein kinase domain-containing protein n=1 Tax=unclassified Modestobacter TaxID=2643866 RepID=UPI0022AB9345|nr:MULTISPECIES: protein kinase [unclassified Modestobacter]MCZ2810858.1 protein kinase [Modestobacter sp. VKM Ac-2979]MCZ2840371.1 protein kinase [Modestobacter sp. VKM Ac-2980]
MVEPTRRSLGNRYELATLLASGGMGQVWRGHDQLLDRAVAVKVLRSEYTGDELFLARFRAEAHHAAALSHPNIAAVYDYGEEQAADGSGEHLAYLVMELVEGQSLSTVLAREERLSPDRTLDVLRQTASALAVAHAAGVVHRDVKPGNVLVRWDGTVKITDFGIAWSAGSVPLTQTGQVVGTASYLSPEQASGAHATAASDVYALGMVGYECLTGGRAFDGDNSVTIALRHLRDQPAPLPAELPEGVRRLVERAIVKDPAQRYPDGEAVVAAIDEVLAGRELPAVQRTDTQSFWLLPDAAALAGASSATERSTRRPAPQGGLGRLLVPLVALLVGAGLAAVVLQAFAPTGTTPIAAAVEVPGEVVASPATVVLDAADYLGRPVDAVRAQLEALDLVVEDQPAETDSADPGTVVDVAPLATELRAGETVLISYAVAPSDTPAPVRPSRERTVDTVVQQPAPAPATTPAPKPTRVTTPTPTATTGGRPTGAPVEEAPADAGESAEGDDGAEDEATEDETDEGETDEGETDDGETDDGETLPDPGTSNGNGAGGGSGNGNGGGNGNGSGNGGGNGKPDKD